MPRSPQDFLRFIAKHYPLVVSLCKGNHRFACDDDLHAFVSPFVASDTSPSMLVARMKALGIINQNAGDWSPPPFLGRFLNEVEQRHVLASPGVVRAWVGDLTTLTERFEAIDVERGLDAAGEVSNILDEIAEKISSIAHIVAGNCTHIAGEVARYRTEEDARQMRLRLSRLIDLHENYLLPVLQIIDVGGDFYNASERLLNRCSRILAGIPQSHSAASIASSLLHDIMWLRRCTLRQAHEANRELSPLCEAATRESKIARGVNRALDYISAGEWNLVPLESDVAVVFEQDGPLLNSRSAAAYLLAAQSYEPVPPPMLYLHEPALLEVPWNVSQLGEELEHISEIPDILEWICDRVGRDVPDTAAGLLHELIDVAADHCQAQDDQRAYGFAAIDVHATVWAWRKHHV